MKALKKIYDDNKDSLVIDPSLYARYNVKQGLRNENGTGVKVGLTRICDVVGYQMVHGQKVNKEGKLIFRNQSIQDLVNLPNAYEQTAYLLIFGKLPSELELLIFHDTLTHISRTDLIDETYQTKNILNALQIEVLKLYGTDPNPDTDSLESRMIRGITVLASMPLFVFSNYHHMKITQYPYPDKSFAENILCLHRQSNKVTKQEVDTLNALLVLHADHGGGNNSTFANVVISSTGTDIYSCISASIGSLKGPRHGGANAKVFEQFQYIFEHEGVTTDPDKLYQIAVRLLNKDYYDHSGLIYGVGHAVYTLSDPRAVAIKEASRKLAIEKGRLEEFECLEAFEKAALRAMKDIKGIETCVNVDFYSGFTYSMLGFDSTLFTPLFCMARCAGWVAHHLENRQNNRKLIRPSNVYIG